MKNLIKIISLVVLVFCLGSCQEDDPSVGDIVAPTNILINSEILGVDSENPNGDGSGLVNFNFTSQNALSYKVNYGDGTSEMVPSGQVTHRYSRVGLNTYTVVLSAIGTGGVSSTATMEVSVFSSFDDLEAKQLLSGGTGSSKTWYWAASEPGHLGVGGSKSAAPDAYWYPSYYTAQAFEKAGSADSDCLYTDELTFSLNAQEELTYQLDNNGKTFFNAGYESVVGGSAGTDFCYEYNTVGVKNVSLAPTSVDWSSVPDPNFTSRGTVMNFSDNGFMGYFIGASSYEIISLTSTSLYVRVMDANNPALFWYHKFSTSPPTPSFESIYNDLVWEDTFDTNGAPNPDNWTFDLGNGVNGWGNNEVQMYTDSAENIKVEDGILKITAKVENGNYTSSRIKTENLFEFTYGRVEVRAKLPTGGGTWPAIWMLGQNFDTVSWPACGEIDIMEHVGNDQNTIHSTLHFPGNSGGNGVSESTTVATASTEFHNYSVEWTPDFIKFLVDDTVYHTFPNTAATPFNSDFFLILNVAMGGNFGGAIDPAFTASTLEIDYVKIYR